MTDGRQREGPLCWSQWWIWLAELREARVQDFRLRITVGADKLPHYVAAALETVIDRHEALRTTFEYYPDGLHPRQIVWSLRARRYDLQIAPADSLPPNAWFMSTHIRGYDLTEMWPIRALLAINRDGTSELCLRVHHLAIDYHGLRLLYGELSSLLTTSTTAALLPDVHRQPVDIALEERSRVGRSLNIRSLEFQMENLTKAKGFVQHTSSIIERKRTGSDLASRQAMANVTSTGLGSRIHALSRSIGIPPSGVLLAAITGGFAKFLNYNQIVYGVMVSNRHLPGVKNTICHLANLSSLSVTFKPGESFDKFARRCYLAVISTMKHGHFHPNPQVLQSRSLGYSVFGREHIFLNVIADDVDGSYSDGPDKFEIQTREVLRSGAIAGAAIMLGPSGVSISLNSDTRFMTESDMRMLVAAIFESVGADGIAVEVVQAARSDDLN